MRPEPEADRAGSASEAIMSTDKKLGDELDLGTVPIAVRYQGGIVCFAARTL